MAQSNEDKLRRALLSLIDASEDVLKDFNATHFPVGADLADSIRVFLKSAVDKSKRVYEQVSKCKK